jgi:hypothetical protein
MKKILIFISLSFLVFCNSGDSKKVSNTSKKDGRPTFYKGIYISNPTARIKTNFNSILEESSSAGINAMIVDAQPRNLPDDLITRMKEKNIHGIARVVAFDLGLVTEFPTKEHMNKLIATIRYSCDIGFKEINLDYIRYADGGWKFKANFEKRYANMMQIITELKEGSKESCGSDVKYGADVFGRVPFIQNDAIGQRIEEYSQVVDIIYPMLYPSHFYGLKERMGDPYNTVKEGLERTMERSKPGTEAIVWVQGFHYYIGVSGLSFKDYIKVQMQAALDSKSRGFVVWNARNDYKYTFQAFEEFQNENFR